MSAVRGSCLLGIASYLFCSEMIASIQADLLPQQATRGLTNLLGSQSSAAAFKYSLMVLDLMLFDISV
eukprot:1780915-Ditylum_brightwellii.AAC.1